MLTRPFFLRPRRDQDLYLQDQDQDRDLNLQDRDQDQDITVQDQDQDLDIWTRPFQDRSSVKHGCY
jgi:hypothetical protein